MPNHLAKVGNDDQTLPLNLSDFKTESEKNFGLVPASDRQDITILNRRKTDKGSPIIVSFDIPFKNVTQATLKTTLLAPEGFGIGALRNEWRLNYFILNGHRFEVSDAINSINLVDRSNDVLLNKVLKQTDNQLQIHFNAPIGAGIVSPHAEISAILTVFGERDPFALPVPNVTELSKKAESIIEGLKGLGIIAGIAVIIIASIVLIFLIRTGGKGL